MDLSTECKKLRCPICDEVAFRDHLNYGAISCYSCRAFFRRIHKVSADDPLLSCIHGGKCQINLKTRRRCKKCRYDLCIRAGMQPKAVLNESERKTRFKNSFYRSLSTSEESIAVDGSSVESQISVAGLSSDPNPVVETLMQLIPKTVSLPILDQDGTTLAPILNDLESVGDIKSESSKIVLKVDGVLKLVKDMCKNDKSVE